ncbi:UNVERIFIED_CONTAM: hypothetical protein GTU68_041065 [Idotea baltica]|nr:hypothetical protein [Idotea baltica]
MVMAQSLFMDIKQREPDAIIDVLAPAWTAALIDRMPQVRRLVKTGFQHGKLNLAERYSLAKRLRKTNYTHSIVLPNSIKSALVPALARIPLRTGFVGEQRWGLLNDIRRLDKTSLPMTVQRFISLGNAKESPLRSIDSIPAPSLKIEQAVVRKVQDEFSLDKGSQALALCPGAEFGASKQWPLEYYAELAIDYLAKGWQLWLLGSEKDKLICDQINQKSGNNCRVLAGKTSLPQAIDVLSMADLVVSNDSGLMHIAAALQIPLVAVYGSTDPKHTPPLSKNHLVARIDLECSPCFKRVCPLNHHNCMQQLQSSAVIELCEKVVQ